MVCIATLHTKKVTISHFNLYTVASTFQSNSKTKLIIAHKELQEHSAQEKKKPPVREN